MSEDSARHTHTWLAPRFAARPAAEALVRAPEAVVTSGEVIRGGRGAHHLLPASDWGVAVRVRPGRRGGVFGPWLGARYAGPSRARREHARVCAAFEAGLPVVEPAFAVAWRRGLTWRIATATVDRPGARDALAWLDANPGVDAHVVAARAIALTLRRLHQAGYRHGDLQLRNLLLEHDDALDLHCLAIDFDRARREGAPLSPRTRLREWMRLVRSCEKTGWASVLTGRVVAAALATYCEGGRARRHALLEHLPAETARIRRHRVLWKR